RRRIASVQNVMLAPDDSAVRMDVRRIADDGFLVIPDAKGHVTSSKNMFGDNLEVGGKKFANGFLALQALAQKDCQSTSIKDRYFGPWDKDLYDSKIKVWVDRNRNGVDEQGEIISLKDAGVVALNTCNVVHQQETDSFGNGTALRSAFLFSSNTQIDSLLSNEDEILKQLEEGETSKGEKAEFRLAVDLVFQTYPDQILKHLEQLSLVSR
ncbi:MAG: iron-regulated protein frpA, partial [Bdellovibrionaceae bacterium]|nr:iron-regulated protein frpA [Pseudobdellovibrionaceae bacterium]